MYSEDVWGYYMPDEQEPYIHIDAKVRTRRMLIDTLCHEMIHQLQNERWMLLTHGAFFKKQAARLAKHGITI